LKGGIIAIKQIMLDNISDVDENLVCTTLEQPRASGDTSDIPNQNSRD
jgi:hypothetical protein